MKRRSIIYSFASNALPALSGAAAFFLLVRMLEKEDLGEWIIFLTSITLFEMFRSGLVQSGFVRSLSGEDEGHERHSLAAAWVLAGTVSIGVAVVMATAAMLSSDHRMALSALSGYAIVSLPLALGEWRLQARDDFGSVVVLRSANRIPFLAFCSLFLAVGLGSVSVVYAAFLSSILASSLLALLTGWIRFPGRPEGWRPALAELVRFGRSSVWSAAGSNLLRSSDTMLIGALAGAASAALYGLPLRILEVIELPVRSLVNVFYPRLSALSKQGRLVEAWSEWTRALKLIFLLVLLIATGGILLAEVLVELVGGGAYAGSVLILQWMFAFSLLIPLDRLTGIFLDALGHPAANARKVWMMLSVNVTGNVVVLGLGFPLWTVAAVSIITFGLGCLWGIVMVRRILRENETAPHDLVMLPGKVS